jgi:endogenous inhibitor of DNA gyrase (YacG/DUF329 family)
LIDFDKWASEEYRVPGQHINPTTVSENQKQSEHNGSDYEE